MKVVRKVDRECTSLIHSQRDTIFRRFMLQYRVRLTKWAKTLCRTWDLPRYMYEDLLQAGLFTVWKNIPKWNSDIANLWTYSYLGIRKAMMAVVREHFNMKRWSATPIERYVVSYDEMEYRSQLQGCSLTFDEMNYKGHVTNFTEFQRVKVRIIIDHMLQENPTRTNRVLHHVFVDNSLSEVARNSEGTSKRISRQGLHNSIQRAMKGLRQDMEAIYG